MHVRHSLIQPHTHHKTSGYHNYWYAQNGLLLIIKLMFVSGLASCVLLSSCVKKHHISVDNFQRYSQLRCLNTHCQCLTPHYFIEQLLRMKTFSLQLWLWVCVLHERSAHHFSINPNLMHSVHFSSISAQWAIVFIVTEWGICRWFTALLTLIK